MANELEQLVLKKAQSWLDGHYDEATKKQVKCLMDNDMKELVESFYKDLEFGTGGLRGIMGVGSNRMNVYTVGAATQGLSNYLKKNFAGEQIRVAVGHDSRNNSRMFAERVADKGKRAEAVSIMVVGMTVANLFGVPLGTYISNCLLYTSPSPRD